MSKKTGKAPKLPRCRTPEECDAISRGLKQAYKSGRRYVRKGFTRAPQ